MVFGKFCVRHSWLAAFAILFASALASMAVRSAISQDAPRPMNEISSTEFKTNPDGKLLGAGSCAGTACHNGSDAATIKGREYSLCVNDKHDRAFAVLLDERSKKIEQRYHGLPDWRTAQPERDLLCLKCHVHPEIARRPMLEIDGLRQFRFEDGVSCEACHGPAERWLDLHHRPAWLALSSREKQTHFGMTDTRGLHSRIRGCVACHVGAPGMEVDHDLIAAGHPRLAFEFAGSQALMTKHWDDAADRDPARGGRPSFETEAWANGQLLALKASLELLQHRLLNKPGPEFAEFDCYACHHDLRNPGSKQDREFSGRTAGKLTWNRWPIAQVENAFKVRTGRVDPRIVEGLQTIGREMTTLAPNKTAVRQAIAVVIAGLEDALRQPASPVLVRDTMKAIASAKPQTWDDAAQAFNGLVALEKTRIDTRQAEIPELRSNLESLRRLLLPDARYRLSDVAETMDRIKKAVQQ